MNIPFLGKRGAERAISEQPKRRRDITRVIEATESRLKNYEHKIDDCEKLLERLGTEYRNAKTERVRNRIREQARRMKLQRDMFVQQDQRCYNRLLNLRHLQERVDDQDDIRNFQKVFSDVRKDFESMPNHDAIDAEEESLQVEEMFTNMDENTEAMSRHHSVGSSSGTLYDEDIDNLLNDYAVGEDNTRPSRSAEDGDPLSELYDGRERGARPTSRRDGGTRSHSGKDHQRRARDAGSMFAAVDDYSL